MDAELQLNQALFAARSAWIGCDWDTEFGDRKQNLRGLRSRQAKLAAQATRGNESMHWWDVYRFLERIETDARSAAALATAAVAHWQRGEWTPALDQIDRAIALEAAHHPPHVYSRLRQLMIWASQATHSP